MNPLGSHRINGLMIAMAMAALAPMAFSQTADKPAATATSAIDKTLHDSLLSGNFSGWRRMISERLASMANRTDLKPEEYKDFELNLARHEFLLQTMPNEKLSPATRPALAGAKKREQTSKVDALAEVSKTPEGKAFLRWLLNDVTALNNYLEATCYIIPEMDRTYGLNTWARIWQKYPESRTTLWCRVAAAFAVCYDKERTSTETAWDQKIERVLDPVERFAFYRESFEKGKLVPYFSIAPTWELVLTVHGSFRTLEEMEWMQQMLPSDRFNQRGAASMAYQIVRYRLRNYRDSSIHGSAYFDGKPNQIMAVADLGSVCGGISNAGTSVATAFGVPSFTIGQPGHCAYVSKGSPTSWDGGNFVSGWKDSFNAHQISFFASHYSVNVKLLTRLYNHPAFNDAEYLRRLSNVMLETNDQGKALALLTKASSICPIHFLVRSAQTTLLMESDKPAVVDRLRKECVSIASDLAEFPIVTDVLRDTAETKRLNVVLTPEQRAVYLGDVATGLASVPSSRQQNLGAKAFADTFTRQLVTFGLKNKEIGNVLANVLSPKKKKPDDHTPEPPPPTLKAPEKAAELIRYLNALTKAANSREIHAQIVNAVIAALPEEVRSRVNLKPQPTPEPQPAKYNEKTFARIGDWTRDSIEQAVEVTDGWRELKFDLPKTNRHTGPLTVAFVQKNGETITFENLRLFANGTEVDHDDKSVPLKGKKSGLFTVTIDPETTKATLSIKVVVTDGIASDGEVRILEPTPVETAKS